MNAIDSKTLLAMSEPSNGRVEAAQVADVVAMSCPPEAWRHKRVLVIVPDGTRTAPIGMVFKALFAHLDGVAAKLDVLIALGTHQPMSEAAICRRLEISLARAGAERTGTSPSTITPGTNRPPCAKSERSPPQKSAA